MGKAETKEVMATGKYMNVRAQMRILDTENKQPTKKMKIAGLERNPRQQPATCSPIIPGRCNVVLQPGT